MRLFDRLTGGAARDRFNASHRRSVDAGSRLWHRCDGRAPTPCQPSTVCKPRQLMTRRCHNSDEGE